MRLGWAAIVVVSGFLTGPAARAQPPAAPAPRFAVAVRLVVPRDTAVARHLFDGADGLVNPATRVAVGQQARDAYEKELRSMFDPAPPGSAAELVVELTSSEVELDRNGWFASVEHELVLRAASGAEVARWRVRGEGRIAGLGERAVPAAFGEAAEYAARTFSAEFETHPAASAWLAGAGISPRPGSLAPKAPPRLEPTPVPVVRARAAELLFAELGASAIGADGGLSGAVSARAGWSGRPWLLQLALDLWQRPFTAHPVDGWGSGDGELYTFGVGLDAGVQRRLGSRFEVQAGGGVAALIGHATAVYTPLAAPDAETESSVTSVGLDASVFAAARWAAVLPRTGIRYRLGVEVRRRFGASLDFPKFGRELAVADLSVGFFAGLELPAGQ